jgi:hypothetical protein
MLPTLKGLFAVAILALAANDPNDPEPPGGKLPKADVRGQITSVSLLKAAGTTRVLVTGVKEADTEFPNGTITLTATTKIFKWNNGRKVAAKVEDLNVGVRVQCLVTRIGKSKIRAIGTADEIIILPAVKK